MKSSRTLIFKAILAAVAVALSTTTVAQRTSLACQEDASAGLNWERGEWTVKRFKTEKFILVQEGKSLTTDSVGRAFNKGSIFVSCFVKSTGVICIANMGESLLFNPESMKGARTHSLGSISTDPAYRDSIAIAPFSCQPF